ncbi:gas vesicle protein GvpO [Phaeacidiphilus oryzae]|jgi:hypothetical protein|uniref:gas vesicle protein GvpO n=1 Tax=Phaeacidiphilus oryzae TaxID=348818 RepID=UPI000563F88D|nr:gas vesicle protein [Phaeacidiphilus oryzae]
MAERRTGSATKKSSSSRSASGWAPEDVAHRACRSLEILLTHPVEGVSAVCRSEDGWRVHVDVLEVARIPDTTSLLATYEVDLDGRGELLQYRRIRRYRRGSADD